MKKILVAATVATLSLLGANVGAASAAGLLCGSVHVVVNGEDVVNQATCQELPPAQ